MYIKKKFEICVEDDCAEICSKCVEEDYIKKKLSYKNYDQSSAYFHILTQVFYSQKIISFYKVIFDKKNYNSNVFEVSSYEEELIVKHLLKKFNLKKIKIVKKKNYFCILKIVFLKLLVLVTDQSFIGFSEKKKNKDIILCFSKNKNEKNSFDLYLNNTKLKKLFFSINFFFFLKNINITKRILNFNEYAKEVESTAILKLHLKLNLIENIVNKISPKLILFFEGDNDKCEIINSVSKKKNIKSVCLQWGVFTSPVPKASFRKMTSDYLFVWGNFYKKKFSIYNKKTKIFVSGNPTINLKKKKITTNQTISFFLSKEGYLVSSSDINDFKKIMLWIKKNFIKYKIIIRPHPFDTENSFDLKSDFYKGFIIHDPHKIPIYQTINESSIMMAIFSSSVIESGRIGTIPILVNNSNFSYEDSIEKIRDINNIKLIGSSEVIKKTLIKLFNNHQIRNNLKKKIMQLFNKNIKYIGNTSQKIIANKINNILNI
jgi:hypothetical protein